LEVSRWRNGKMVLRWAAAALLMTEQNFHGLPGSVDAESGLRPEGSVRSTGGGVK